MKSHFPRAEAGLVYSTCDISDKDLLKRMPRV